MSFLSVLFHHKMKLMPFPISYGNSMSLTEVRQRGRIRAVLLGGLGLVSGVLSHVFLNLPFSFSDSCWNKYDAASDNFSSLF